MKQIFGQCEIRRVFGAALIYTKTIIKKLYRFLTYRLKRLLTVKIHIEFVATLTRAQQRHHPASQANQKWDQRVQKWKRHKLQFMRNLKILVLLFFSRLFYVSEPALCHLLMISCSGVPFGSDTLEFNFGSRAIEKIYFKNPRKEECKRANSSFRRGERRKTNKLNFVS